MWSTSQSAQLCSNLHGMLMGVSIVRISTRVMEQPWKNLRSFLGRMRRQWMLSLKMVSLLESTSSFCYIWLFSRKWMSCMMHYYTLINNNYAQGSDQFISFNSIQFQFKLDSRFFNSIQFQFKSDSESFNSIPIQLIFFQFQFNSIQIFCTVINKSVRW